MGHPVFGVVSLGYEAASREIWQEAIELKIQ